MRSKTKKIVFLGLLASLAMVLSYIEMLLPPIYSAFPGIKMGLPNIVIIFTLYKMGLKEAATVSFVRIVCVSHLFGTPLTLAYSIAGGLLSLMMMAILKKTDRFSTVGVSVAGGISHNVGQILVAILLLKRVELGFYLIILAVTGTVAGILIGLTGAYLLKKLTRFDPTK